VAERSFTAFEAGAARSLRSADLRRHEAEALTERQDGGLPPDESVERRTRHRPRRDAGEDVARDGLAVREGAVRAVLRAGTADVAHIGPCRSVSRLTPMGPVALRPRLTAGLHFSLTAQR
jgi:hypothetical protein